MSIKTFIRTTRWKNKSTEYVYFEKNNDLENIMSLFESYLISLSRLNFSNKIKRIIEHFPGPRPGPTNAQLIFGQYQSVLFSF